MTICATRTQKAKVGQLTVDGITDQRARGPGRVHVVVVPRFASIKAKPCSFLNQNPMAQSIASRMGENCEPTSLMNGIHHRFSTQGLTNHGITVVVEL